MERWFVTVYKPVTLEIKIPKEIQKPIRAMENVMAAIHGVVYHPPDRWERFIEGQVQVGVSFDVVSIGGEIRFYIRFWEVYREAVEAAIYSQYPEVEITQVDDYIKQVPPNIPNKDWNLFAIDYCLLKPNPYPIKTYPQFETERERKLEQIVDPIANLLEGLAKLKPGEQFWVQIRATPLATSKEPGAPKGTSDPFLKEAEALRDELVKRPGKPKRKPIIQEAVKILVTGKPTEEPTSPPEELYPLRMNLTPGEEEVINKIEKKSSKPIFSVGIRFIYLGKREVFFKPNFRLGFNFFNCFAETDINALIPWGGTITKIKRSIWFPPLNLIRERRLYLRSRKIFRQYCERFNTLFPRIGADKGFFILNTEELATIWHFPSWQVAPVPGLPRIEAKKGAPPLPILPKE